MSRAGDQSHLLYAAQVQRTPVTNNIKDFLLLHRAWREWSRAWNTLQSHAGILLVPQVRPEQRAATAL